MVKDIKKNLTNIVVIIGLIGSIGAGFIKYGEVMTKIDVLENASKTVDLSMVAVLEEKVKALESVDNTHGHTKILVNEAEIKLLKVASIGALGMGDYPTFIKRRGLEFANKRRKAYRTRMAKNISIVGSNGYYAGKLLW